MTIAGIRRSIREIEDITRGTLIARLLEMSPAQLDAYRQYRAESRAFYARHSDVFARWLDGELEVPKAPPGLFPDPPIPCVGDDAREMYETVLRKNEK